MNDLKISDLVRSGLVQRSAVPAGLPYGEYRPQLRYDFFYSCAYCTMAESEAQAIRFAIDHYEPRAARPDLEHAYDNLMYCCDGCNSRKGDRCPPEEARKAGVRFFRPDQDERSEHFQSNGRRLSARSSTGEYTIEALDLNRMSLRRLREIRERATECAKHVGEGIMALRDFPLDQLPASVRSNALKARQRAIEADDEVASQIDAILRSYAQSPLLESQTEDAAERLERLKRLGRIEALHEGIWRGRYASQAKP